MTVYYVHSGVVKSKIIFSGLFSVRKYGSGSRAFIVYAQYLRFFAKKGDVHSEC